MVPLEVYSREERIGRGSFGEVYVGTDSRSSERVAIKIIDFEKTVDELEDFQREVSLLSQCRSPYVTRYFGAFIDKTKLWIVMEYLAGGSALDLIESGVLDEETIAVVMHQALHGLKYLHGNRIVHSDIKAANILLTEQGHVKLADLGVARLLVHSDSKTEIAGSPFWMAPEVAAGVTITFSSDIWSLGIAAIELADRKTPYSHLLPEEALRCIRGQPPPSLAGSEWNEAFKAFVACCLRKEPSERPEPVTLLGREFVSNVRHNHVPLALLERSARYREQKRNSSTSTGHSSVGPGAGQVTWSYPATPSSTLSSSPSLTVMQRTDHACVSLISVSSATSVGGSTSCSPDVRASRCDSVITDSTYDSVEAMSTENCCRTPVKHFDPGTHIADDLKTVLPASDYSAPAIRESTAKTSEKYSRDVSSVPPQRFGRFLTTLLLDSIAKLLFSSATSFY